MGCGADTETGDGEAGGSSSSSGGCGSAQREDREAEAGADGASGNQGEHGRDRASDGSGNNGNFHHHVDYFRVWGLDQVRELTSVVSDAASLKLQHSGIAQAMVA